MNKGAMESGERRLRARRRKRRRGGFAIRALVAAALLFAATFCAAFAVEGKEVHGSGDAYTAAGVTLAWGILHGADEASTQVVLRVAVDPKTYASISIIGKNPFGGQERVLLAPTGAKTNVDVHVSRAQYADFPRTELRFYAASSMTAPALVVYYLGVPDTTPEFPDAAKLDAYLTDRIARARAGGKTP